jgi:hypothetical protein
MPNGKKDNDEGGAFAAVALILFLLAAFSLAFYATYASYNQSDYKTCLSSCNAIEAPAYYIHRLPDNYSFDLANLKDSESQCIDNCRLVR